MQPRNATYIVYYKRPTGLGYIFDQSIDDGRRRQETDAKDLLYYKLILWTFGSD